MLFVSFLVGAFWAKPQYQKLKEKNQIIFQQEIVVKSAQQREQKIQSLEERLKKYSNQMEIIKTAIPEDPSLLSFLNYLQKTASEHGLLVKSYSYSVEKNNLTKSNVQKSKQSPSFGLLGAAASPSEGKKKEESISQSALKEGSKVKAMEFNLSLLGSYPGFVGFLSSLEKNSRLIEIDRILLSSIEEDQPTNFGVKLKIYSY